MRKDVEKILEESEKLCRESWEIKNRARRAIEDSKALSDQIMSNIRASRRMLKKLKEPAQKR